MVDDAESGRNIIKITICGYASYFNHNKGISYFVIVQSSSQFRNLTTQITQNGQIMSRGISDSFANIIICACKYTNLDYWFYAGSDFCITKNGYFCKKTNQDILNLAHFHALLYSPILPITLDISISFILSLL